MRLQERVLRYITAAKRVGHLPAHGETAVAIGSTRSSVTTAVRELRAAGHLKGIVWPTSRSKVDCLPADSGHRIPDDATLRRVGPKAAILLRADGTHSIFRRAAA